MTLFNGLSGNLWPIHLKPYKDELLSSWIIRLAHAHGLKLQTFSMLVFGREKNIWNRDIDKFAPDWLLLTISKATATDIKDVFATTLKSYEGILYEIHQPNGNTRWIIPLGIHHRVHKGFGLQYCPLCLRYDSDPYFRKYWRLAFYTECEIHHVLLHDRCPECGSAINFHRAEMGLRSLIKPRLITNCYKCGFDLRNSVVTSVNGNDWKTSISYRTLVDFHQIGWLFTSNSTIQYSHQYFDVIRHLCVLISSNRKTGSLLPYIQSRLGLSSTEIYKHKNTLFEKCNVIERHTLIHCSLWLVVDWPNRFIETCNQFDLSYAYLVQDFINPPFWFYSVIERSLNHTQYSPNSEEMNNAKEHLVRSGEKAGIRKISHLLGYTTLRRKSY